MSTTKSLRVGIVGCGEIAQSHHIPSLLKMKDVEIAAVCDSNEELARIVAKRSNTSRYYADPGEMLRGEELDMVDICTPPKTHTALSIQAMGTGCHVLVEKPMALSLKEADEMVVASKVNGVKLCVVHSMLFYPLVMKAKSMAREGGIGELKGVDIRMSMTSASDGIMNKEHWYHKLPGGIFGEMLPYPIYLAQAFLGSLEPIAVHGRKLGSYNWVVADELRVILEGEKGVATIASSCNWARRVIALDIFATKMNLHVDLRNSVIITYSPERRGVFLRALLSNLSEGSQQIAGAVSRALKVISGRHPLGHYTLIRRFVESIQNDTQSPVTAEEGREAVRVWEQITGQIGGEPGKG